MLVIKVELWPGGNERFKELLGRLDIINDGSGTSKRGNYYTRLYRKGSSTVLKTCEISNYPRLSYTVWELVRRALNMLLGGEHERTPKQTNSGQRGVSGRTKRPAEAGVHQTHDS